MKYPKLNLGQVEALVNILGGMEVVKKILRGTKKPLPPDKGLQPLFDLHGWRLPPPNMKERYGHPVPHVCLASPIEFADNPNLETRFVRTCKRLGIEPPFEPRVFRDRANKTRSLIARDEATREVLCGPCLPILLPSIQDMAPIKDMARCGEIIKKLALPSLVGLAFAEQFPGQQFSDLVKGAWFSVREGSRHEQLITAMSKGPVVALYFPMALQGYLPLAAVEQMESLPSHFLLAGAIDTMAAMIMYPDVLARDADVPDLECAGVGDYNTAFQFSRIEKDLFFSRSHYVVFGDASAGLTVIAEPEVAAS